MNRLLTALAGFCNEHFIDEKILVSPSLAAGHQLAEALPRNGCPWINLRVETVGTLAAQTTAADLASARKRVLSRAQSLALVEQACLQVLGGGSYFGLLRDRPGFHRAMQRTLADLRGSGVSSSALSAELLETLNKASELQMITDAYEKLLVDGGFVDGSDILRMAREKVESQDAPARDAWYLVVGRTDLSEAEKAFIGGLAGERLVVLDVDEPDAWMEGIEPLAISRALGEENEVRAVFRHVTRHGLRFDEVEVICTDSTTFVPLFYDLSSQYGIPCTFAQGIPVTFTHPGQAAVALLDWLEGGYDANSFRRSVANGCFDLSRVSPDGGSPGALAASRIIREAAIGWGIGRYLPCLDGLVGRYEARLNRRADDEADTAADASYLQDRLQTARSVRTFVSELVEAFSAIHTEEGIDYTTLAGELAHLLDRFAAVSTDLDGMALKAISSLLCELAEMPGVVMSPVDAAHRLKEAVTQVSVNSLTPRPGHLHISEYRSGGYSCRPHAFVIGLDDSRHPGRAAQDPILLDGERTRINDSVGVGQLALRSVRPAENTIAMRALLARLRGSVTLSFSCRDILGDREQFASPIVLEAFRLLSGDSDADYSYMLAALDTPVGFVSDRSDCLDDSEWWLSSLREVSHDPDLTQQIRGVYPWLQSGWIAESQRDTPMLTAYDGAGLDMPATELDPCTNGMTLSASRLETLAKCPFKYFVRHVLGVTPVEDISFDPTRWLGPADYGTLMHEVFRRFLEGVVSRGENPSYDLHVSELLSTAESTIARYVDQIPPPNDAAFKAQTDDIRRTCHIFLRMEEEHSRESSPRFFEIPFGYSDITGASDIASTEPVTIDLADGSSFLFSGRIDRIDQASGGWEVWDYKTGSSWGFREESAFNGGRQLQYALYALAAEQLLARAGLEGSVVRSGYVFPSLKADGSRLAFKPDDAGTQTVLADLFGMLKKGVFVASNDKGDCGYCDFSACCGGPGVAPPRTQAKMDFVENAALEPMRRLRDNGN